MNNSRVNRKTAKRLRREVRLRARRLLDSNQGLSTNPRVHQSERRSFTVVRGQISRFNGRILDSRISHTIAANPNASPTVLCFPHNLPFTFASLDLSYSVTCLLSLTFTGLDASHSIATSLHGGGIRWRGSTSTADSLRGGITFQDILS
ncbi:uncharacterized protein LOC112552800 [Pogonomyrmex barbatus]|uniref:Uncharacterized protein LOC112552800 n=1 Tax=Pogonomyrmex barbatus TaxID=144034 RepID=A0A8N1S708_9HYME|nr:uncharacterized protein LOC112552800 [Pogonomyrmex barbatus]